MTQVTWRAPDELVEHVRRAAKRQGHSLNEYLTHLARAATDPQFAADDTDRVRERLERADLLVPPAQPRRRPNADAVARARDEAGRGTPLSDLVAEGR